MGHYASHVVLIGAASHLSYGIMQWTMGHFQSPSCVPWVIMHCPWSWQFLHLNTPHGHGTIAHGTVQMFFLCPMGDYELPMALIGAVSCLSHGPFEIAHGS